MKHGLRAARERSECATGQRGRRSFSPHASSGCHALLPQRSFSGNWLVFEVYVGMHAWLISSQNKRERRRSELLFPVDVLINKNIFSVAPRVSLVLVRHCTPAGALMPFNAEDEMHDNAWKGAADELELVRRAFSNSDFGSSRSVPPNRSRLGESRRCCIGVDSNDKRRSPSQMTCKWERYLRAPASTVECRCIRNTFPARALWSIYWMLLNFWAIFRE